MKRFTKTLMVALMAVCLSVCFLFAGCSKHAGTYVGVSAIGNTSIELKLKAGDEFEMTIGDTIVVKGKITDVGEVLGYSLKIDSFG